MSSWLPEPEAAGGQDPAAASVGSRLAAVRRRIASAGGDPAAVAVVAVTKGFGAAAVRAALAAGLADVGENYATELREKAAATSAALPGPRWHYLGAVQRNKVAALAPLVSLWQGVTRSVEGDAIARRAPGAAVLVQVDTSEMAGRQGCPPAEVAALVEHLRALGLDVRGLMTVGPGGPPGASGPGFALLARLSGQLALDELSMGMSSDLEVAVGEGATMVRIGRALFGERSSPAPRAQ